MLRRKLKIDLRSWFGGDLLAISTMSTKAAPARYFTPSRLIARHHLSGLIGRPAKLFDEGLSLDAAQRIVVLEDQLEDARQRITELEQRLGERGWGRRREQF